MPVFPVVPPASPTVPDPEEDALARLLRGAPRNLVGLGITRPFVRDGRGDFRSERGRALIESAIGQILGTRCSGATAEGELPWRTEFGSLTYLLRHGGNDEVLSQIAKRYVAGAVRRWLPFVRVTSTEVRKEKNEQDDDILAIYVGYVVKSAASSGSATIFSGTARTPLPMAA